MDKIRRYIVVNAKRKLKNELLFNYIIKKIEHKKQIYQLINLLTNFRIYFTNIYIKKFLCLFKNILDLIHDKFIYNNNTKIKIF